ncbi:hypothetical protein ESCO_001864 [Escovopsis weberi]|uniref:Uncharacterized protein n=1 Tax=Escovopsis weberi TaxID=150374 RepID=A0A0M9VWC8_ESCWE|nr:hypothetical protein ESCO_001864 [Escovopsis weberi]
MCHQITYHLVCEHTSTQMHYCAEATTNGRIPCKNFTRDTIPYLALAHGGGNNNKRHRDHAQQPPPCPLTNCPFRYLGGAWNCCWCGYTQNRTGRCGNVMIGDGGEKSLFRCEHICCSMCQPGNDEL